MRNLTKDEKRTLHALAKAFNKFSELPVLHEADMPEFVSAIHRAQNIVLGRPAYESQFKTAKE